MVMLIAFIAFCYVVYMAFNSNDAEEVNTKTSENYGCAKVLAMIVFVLFGMGTLGPVGLIIAALIIIGLSGKG